MPSRFTQYDWGRATQLDVRTGPRESADRFGRQGGWKALYRRPGSPETPGALVIESRADLFETEDGAAEDLTAYRRELSREVDRRSGQGLDAPSLGDEASAITYVQPGAAPIRYFTVAWREANVTASVTISGFDGKVTLEAALDLARRQQERISAAASG